MNASKIPCCDGELLEPGRPCSTCGARLMEDEDDPVVPVLCGCGWGHLGMRESEVPVFCPMCGYCFKPDEETDA